MVASLIIVSVQVLPFEILSCQRGGNISFYLSLVVVVACLIIVTVQVHPFEILSCLGGESLSYYL